MHLLLLPLPLQPWHPRQQPGAGGGLLPAVVGPGKVDIVVERRPGLEHLTIVLKRTTSKNMIEGKQSVVL